MGYFFSLFSLSKSATNSALNWSELVLLIFGIVLVVGLVGEYKTLEPHSRRMKFFEMLVILGVLGELLGDGGIFLFSHQLQVISDNEIAEVTRNAGDARTSAREAAEAAARANKYVDGIARLSWPRQLDAAKFVALLKDKPQARVKLLYNPNDSEAWSFARDMYWWLGKGAGDKKGAGWVVSSPQPIPPRAVNKRLSSPNTPIGMQFSGAFTGFGITLRLRDTGVPSVPLPSASACGMKPLSNTCLFFAKDALTQAVLMSMLPDERGGAMEAEYDDSLPNGLIVVIVGPRPPIWHLERPKQP